MADSPNQTIQKSVVKSHWLGLSEHLIATFWPVDHDGKRTADNNVQEELQAPIVEGNLEASFTWQSQFENSDVSGSKPTLAAVIQSGVGLDIAQSLGVGQDTLKSLRGRTGITKLNSIQVFTGMPPVKFSVTIVFRAWNDPQQEVEDCLDMLSKWAYPKLLSPTSPLARAIKQYNEGDLSVTNLVFPSEAPTLIAMLYKGRTYKPLVIESIGVPISSPVDDTGRFVELLIPLNLSTLTAIDKNDWANTIRMNT